MNPTFNLEQEYPVKSVGQLRRLFYKENRKPGSLKALILNPPALIDPTDPFSQDIYYAIYSRSRFGDQARYFVTIECNLHHPSIGPHLAQLNIQVYPGRAGSFGGKFIWLGTTTFDCEFFDEREIHSSLRQSCKDSSYFASEASEEVIVEFDIPNPPTISLDSPRNSRYTI